VLSSYAQSFALGHRYLERLFDGPVVVQEKYDGSQFSFGLVEGVLEFRSKGCQVFAEQPDKLFTLAIASATSAHENGLLVEGFVYRGEAFRARKHNAMVYERMPFGGFVLYDVEMDGQHFLPPAAVTNCATMLGVESAQNFGTWLGVTDPVEGVVGLPNFQELLERRSSLGGGPIEGIVIKNYTQLGVDKKFLFGKLVRPEFKEAHATAWRQGVGIVDQITKRYATPMRWLKAVQHLQERGELVNAPQDIGALLVEVKEDVIREHEEDIKDALFQHYRREIVRGLTHGLPEWYKASLSARIP